MIVEISNVLHFTVKATHQYIIMLMIYRYKMFFTRLNRYIPTRLNLSKKDMKILDYMCPFC